MHGHALTHLRQNTHLKLCDLRQKKRPSQSKIEGAALLGVISSHPSEREGEMRYVTKGIHVLLRT